jgi:type IV pilus assembly protein PilQ
MSLSIRLILILILVLGVFLSAQNKSAENDFKKKDIGTSVYITLDVRDKDIHEIVAYIREQTGSNIVVDPDISTKVTVTLADVPWLEALNVIAEQAKCEVTKVSDIIWKVSQPPVVSIEFQDADVRKVINTIATVANVNIVYSEDIQGKVNLRLKDVPWREALEAIVKTTGPGYEIVTQSRNILRVVDPKKLKAQTETKVFELKYVRPPIPYLPVLDSETAKESAQAKKQDFELVQALKKVLTQGGVGDLYYDEGTNSIVVTDTKPALDRMSTIISTVDVEPNQVFIDVKFANVRNTDDFTFGFDWTNGININQTFGDVVTRFPFTVGPGGFEDKIVPFKAPEVPIVDPTAPDPNDVSDLNSLVTFGRLNFAQTEIVLQLLKNDTTSRVLQAPKIITLDNHAATIFVGDAIRYAVTNIILNDNGTTQVSLVESPNSPVTFGFRLFVRPYIIPGTEKMFLTVIPENDTLTGTGGQGILAGFNRFTSGQNTLDLPQIRSQSMITNVKVESGESIIIGGLYTENESRTTRKVPFLGDLPLLGYLFKQTSHNKSNDDLLIFISPRIISSSSATGKELQDRLVRDQELQERDWNAMAGEVYVEESGSSSSKENSDAATPEETTTSGNDGETFGDDDDDWEVSDAEETKDSFYHEGSSQKSKSGIFY